MLTYSFANLKKSVSSTLLLALLFSTVPTTLSSLQATKLSTDQSIAEFGRGSYDILVRSKGAIADIEKTKGIVEENYLTGGQGGISIEQYEKIKQIGGVETAAPVGVLGFFTNSSGGLVLDLPKIDSSIHISTLKFSGKTGLSPVYHKENITNLLTTPYKDNPFIPDRSSDYNSNTNQAAIALPDNYNLLVAVDPKEEAKLTGQTVLASRLPSQVSFAKQQDTTLNTIDGNPLPILPILVNKDLTTPMQLEIEERVPSESPDALKEQLLHLNNLSDVDAIFEHDLKRKPEHTTVYDLTAYIHPFQEAALQIGKDGTITTAQYGYSSYLDNSLYYLTDKLNYKISNDQKSDLTLVPDEVNHNYRTIKPTGILDATQRQKFALFQPKVVGEYHANEVTTKNQDPAPLGIYSFAPVVQIEDSSGKPSRIELHKDLTPDTFMPIPAAGLTTLEAAKLVKGNTPIDAIRIRVAGIGKYDSVAEQKILQVAQTIQNQTGLHTDIVAGASKQTIKVNIQAVASNPAVGIIQEVWTTLGVSTLIKNVTNQLSLYITGVLILLVLLYTVVQTQTMFVLRHKEFNILYAIGWNKKDIRKLLLQECGIKTCIAFGVSLLLLFVIQHYLHEASFWKLAILAQVIVVVLLLCTVYLTVNKLHDRVLNLGKDAEWKGVRLSAHSIRAITMSNFKGQMRYNIWNILMIAVSGAMAFFTLNAILAERSNISKTFLGETVNAATGSSQWLIVAVCMILVVFGLWDTSKALVVKREREIYILRIIGWSRKHIRRMIAGEMMIVFITGAVLAIILGLGAFGMLFASLPIQLLLQIVALLVLIGCLIGIGSVILQKLTAKVM